MKEFRLSCMGRAKKEGIREAKKALDQRAV
jgi:hypothetical protein